MVSILNISIYYYLCTVFVKIVIIVWVFNVNYFSFTKRFGSKKHSGSLGAKSF